MTTKYPIAIVEDHDGLREGFIEYLSTLNYDVTGTSCGEELDEYLTCQQPVVLILDIGLPGEDGFSIAHRIRKSHPGMYIIMLTALSNEPDKIRGYECGADIYLPKPVSPAELSAAIQAACRRMGLTNKPAPGLSLDLTQSTICGNADPILLNVPERALLKALAEAQDQKLPTWRLLEVITAATGAEAEKSYLELQIFRLRKKLLEAGAANPAIKSIWKEGYMLLQHIELI